MRLRHAPDQTGDDQPDHERQLARSSPIERLVPARQRPEASCDCRRQHCGRDGSSVVTFQPLRWPPQVLLAAAGTAVQASQREKRTQHFRLSSSPMRPTRSRHDRDLASSTFRLPRRRLLRLPRRPRSNRHHQPAAPRGLAELYRRNHEMVVRDARSSAAPIGARTACPTRCSAPWLRSSLPSHNMKGPLSLLRRSAPGRPYPQPRRL